MATERRDKSIDRFKPLLFIGLLAGAFWVGSLWQKVQFLEKGITGGSQVANQPAAGAGTGTAPTGPSPLTVDSLKAYAKELKLDEKKFNSCLDDGKYAKAVADDMAYGGTVGVNGTPGFLINGYLMTGAQPFSSFKTVIDFLVSGGDMANPSAEVKTLIDSQALVATKKEVDPGNAPAKGKASASIKMVEFSDFECPFCSQFFKQTYPSIIKDYVDPGKVQFFYKHFPLPFHPNAQKAAEAAECAKEQSKFWEMHDKLFSVQG